MDIIDSRDYVDKAEAVISSLIQEAKQKKKQKRGMRHENDYDILTTTQLRKQISMTAELFTQAEKDSSDLLSQELIDKIEYLRVQFVYQAGRDPLVKDFVDKAGILLILKTIKGKREDFLIFCRYMEALVAFRKYLGNVDK